ncbi:ASCH domain-containing protein [Vibrio sp. D431a]|uniref:ASCH domain-containing protein n=1 Tax=Vibrio sp. D431a TaxID=2837388 RepID=UPI0025550D72|nr:ASCH domain-containing protein [Vibrio sp. D431a]MDK9790127.1 ASCH domain-containing protein [Vibrio sp. D431a]
MKILHLNLKKQYFEDIRDKTKSHEFRLYNDYWKKRLEGRDYDEIHIKMGYPKSDDYSRIVVRPYLGFEVKTIVHEFFDNVPTKVFAIRVNEDLEEQID